MSDKKILEEVYRRLVNEKEKYRTALPSPIIDFIEQEWQRRDEKDAKVAADEMMEAADEVFDCRHDNYFGPNEFTTNEHGH